MKHKHVIGSLPLLASVLGRKYGVQVRIGGNTACTDGNIIHLPGLPLDCDDTLLGLVRGWIDHESAHIRDTDFAALRTASVSPLEKYLWNLIEDWRAENVLSALYPGCRENFQWLIRHMFLPKEQSTALAHENPAARILEWLLITVRSWDVSALDPERDFLRADVETWFPGLTREVEPVLRQVHAQCASTQDAVRYAQEIAVILKRYAHFLEQQQQQQAAQADGYSDPSAQTDPGAQPGADQTDQAGQALQSLQGLLSARNTDLPSGIGEQVQSAITDACAQPGGKTQVAVCTAKLLSELAPQDQDACRQATTALRARLQAMLQSLCAVGNHSGYAGAIDTRKLHRLAMGDARIFLRRGERISVNTAVHILLDSSGSMGGNPIILASQACFAVASALGRIKGINLGVTVFPGDSVIEGNDSRRHCRTVTPVLRHGQAMHSRFSTNAGGSTPMDSALWWVMQQIHPLPEPRKIILVITDGEPNDREAAREAIRTANAIGFEVYGIGIQSLSVTSLLPEQRCRVIATIGELAPAMFAVLGQSLLRHDTA